MNYITAFIQWIFSFWWKNRQDTSKKLGATEQLLTDMVKTLKDSETANEIRDKNSIKSDADIHAELMHYWSRK